MNVKKPIETIDEYVKGFPKDVQTALLEIRRTIRKAAPRAEEMISYGMPTFKLDGKGLVAFAAWKRFISLYGTPAGDKAFQKEASRYRGTKSSLHFSIGAPIPQDLVRKFVEFRRKERQV